MKKTIIALLALAGVASADTINPLNNAEDWSSASNYSGRHTDYPLPTIENGSYSWQTNWGQGYSSYTFGEAITLKAGSTDTLSLQYTLTTGKTNDGVMTLALLGSDGTDTIVSGMSYKAPIRYALTETAANSYTFGPEASWGTVLTGTNLNDQTAGNTSYTISYDILWNAEAGNFELTVGMNGTYTKAISMGAKDISFSGLVITTDGGHQGPSYATISGLSVTTVTNVPEPTTATLSLLALAGLAARRRRK